MKHIAILALSASAILTAVNTIILADKLKRQDFLIRELREGLDATALEVYALSHPVDDKEN
ncbi:MAG: hypothetical protein MJ068_04695 [Clostridia bacterium]|nr:hypothetical protein [Clostridia bacterium]